MRLVVLSPECLNSSIPLLHTGVSEILLDLGLRQFSDYC